VHTAPPVPPFIKIAHDLTQPPLATPAQFKLDDAASAHEPITGLQNLVRVAVPEEATYTCLARDNLREFK
jgi:hypothetical protein